MFPEIVSFVENLKKDFDSIPEDRKALLAQLSQFVQNQVNDDKPIALIYICTHNSRRSHFGQIWAKVAAYYYGFTNIETYSGGTEATAFNANAIASVRRTGFEVVQSGDPQNPFYKVVFDTEGNHVLCFSKKYDDVTNPSSNFAAVMT
jgi:protein-tyrosine phosphatase/arsenate reductase